MKYKYTFLGEAFGKYDLPFELDAPLPLTTDMKINLHEVMLVAAEAEPVDPILFTGVIKDIKLTLVVNIYMLKHKKEPSKLTCYVDVQLH